MSDFFAARDALEPVSREDLVLRLEAGLVTVLDVRPGKHSREDVFQQRSTSRSANWSIAWASFLRTGTLLPIAAAPIAFFPSTPWRRYGRAATACDGLRTAIPNGKRRACQSKR